MMVLTGLFSRFVLGFPLNYHMSAPVFRNTTQSFHFPDGGNRTSLRFISICRSFQRRRRKIRKDNLLEEELTMTLSGYEASQFEFIGEVIDQERETFPRFLKAP